MAELNPVSQSLQETLEGNAVSEQLMEHASRNRRRGPDPFGKPSELLQKIGLRGKEVVRILKSGGWEVCDPKALQEHKVYYLPGGRAKGELAVHGEDFFVGEGELFAYILEKGGIRFLLPDEVSSTETKVEESESDFEILDQPPPRLEPTQHKAHATPSCTESERPSVSLGERDSSDEESSLIPTETSDPQPPKRKRRKKLSTAEKKASAQAKPKRKPRKKNIAIEKKDTKGVLASSASCVKEEKIPFVAADGCGHFVEFGAYEAALIARGWRAQLLQDIDLHLLRSVAAISRRQLALEVTGGEQKLLSRPSEGSSSHEGVLQELKVLSSGIKASQNDLSSMIAAIIGQAEQVQSSDCIECAARIGIPGFVSTGSGNLMLIATSNATSFSLSLLCVNIFERGIFPVTLEVQCLLSNATTCEHFN